jgi:hypothetical protein
MKNVREFTLCQTLGIVFYNPKQVYDKYYITYLLLFQNKVFINYKPWSFTLNNYFLLYFFLIVRHFFYSFIWNGIRTVSGLGYFLKVLKMSNIIIATFRK